MDVTALLNIKKPAKAPDISPGDTVRVSFKIVEGEKERIQVFQGVVIKIRKGGAGASYTVRHVAFGIGVERTFPITSPLVEKIEVVRQGKVRRSRLYYLRNLSGKEARRKIKRVERTAKQVGEELLAEAPEEVIEPVMDEAVAAAPVAETPVAAAEVKTEAAAPEAEKPAEEVKAPEAVKEEPAAEAKTEAAAPEAEKPVEEVKAPEAVKEEPAAEAKTEAAAPEAEAPKDEEKQ